MTVCDVAAKPHIFTSPPLGGERSASLCEPGEGAKRRGDGSLTPSPPQSRGRGSKRPHYVTITLAVRNSVVGFSTSRTVTVCVPSLISVTENVFTPLSVSMKV